MNPIGSGAETGIGLYEQYSPYLEAIEADLAAIPITSATELNINAARVSIANAYRFERGWEYETRYGGLFLVHAKARAGMLPKVLHTDGGCIVQDENCWVDVPFARLAMYEYNQGAMMARELVPKKIQDMILKFAPVWFERCYKLPYSTEAFNSLLAPQALFVPMDHFTKKRSFWGDIMHYPSDLVEPVFNILKVTTLPLTFYSSDRPENHFQSYIYRIAKVYNMDPATLLRENGAHETTHTLAVEPIVNAIVEGPSHSWLTEGLVILLSEKEGFRFQLSKVVGTEPTIQEIISNKNINYGESFLLIATLAYKLGNGDIKQGTLEIYNRLHARALAIQKGETVKYPDFTSLHLLLDPTLEDPDEVIKTEKRMLEVMDLLLKGDLKI